MSNKKRTTVTTIETHEVWIIRKGVPNPSQEDDTLMPREIAQPAVPSLSQLKNSSETEEEQEL